MKKRFLFLIVIMTFVSLAFAKGLVNDVETHEMSQKKLEAQQQGLTFVVDSRDEDITISVTVDTWPTEASWNLWDDTAAAYYYAEDQTFAASGENQTVTIFLTDGLYSVDCWDSYGDGGISGIVTDSGGGELVSWGAGDYTDLGEFWFEVGAAAVEFTVTPAAIEESVAPGTTMDVPLTLANIGTVDFDYTTSFGYPLALALDVQTNSGQICCLGVEPFGDSYWVTSGGATGSGDPNVIFNIAADGTVLGTYDQGTTSTWGMRDLCSDGTYLYAGDDNGFYQIDPADGSVTTLFTGQTFGTIRALARLSDGTFWTKSFSGDIAIFQDDGTLITTYAAAQSAYGAAYDEANDCVWVFEGTTANTPATTFSQWDVVTADFTGVTIAVPMLPGLSAQIIGGAFFVSDGGVDYLGGMVQGTPLDMVFKMELGQDWLDISANGAGTVTVGNSVDITVTLDATGYTRVVKEGLIEIVGEAGLATAEAEVPVLMDLGGGGPGVFPLVEGFENGGVIPDGWTQEYLEGTVDWTFETGGHSGNPATAHTGEYNALFYGGSYTAYTTKLVTPELDLSGAVNPGLTFWLANVEWAGDQDVLDVYYKTAVDGAWILLASYPDEVVDWIELTLALPEPSGTYYIGFEGICGYGYGVCIDDVTVDEVEVDPLPFAEDFEGGVIPDGWTMTTLSAIGWFITMDGSSTYWPVPAGDGYYACSNDDAANDDGSMDYLITPGIDLSGYTNIGLTFDSFLDGAYGQVGTVEVSTDGGTNWDVVATIPTADVWQSAFVSLSAYGGMSDVMVGFHSDDGGIWASGWAIDNVLIDELTGGTLAGTVTDVDGGAPIQDALITIGAMEGMSGADGTYSIDGIPPGTYEVVCFADGYFLGSALDVVIEAGMTTTVDFALDVLVGDTIEDPLYVDFAGNYFMDSGTTSIYTDDYDTGSPDGCPDVVYEFTLYMDTMVDISLLLSEYDTKLGIYEAGVVPGVDNFLYWNDDYTGRGLNNIAEKKTQNRVLQSALYDMVLPAGSYVAVVDGWGTSGNSHGNYVIEITFDPMTIYDVQYTTEPGPDGDYPSLYIGEIVTVTGIVTATNDEYKFWLQDAEGPWNGIYLYSYDLDPIPGVGDEISVTAEVDEYFGLTELLNVEGYGLVSSGNALPGPYVTPTGSVDESLESVYAQILVASCVAEANTYGEAQLDDGTGVCITDDALYEFLPVLDGIYNVEGVFTYSFDEFKLLPRSMGDVEDITNELLWPPVNLEYAIDQNDINLSWTAPTQYGWNTYYPGPLQYLNWAAPERATFYDVTDFGFSYPIDLSAISHYFYHHSAYPWGADTTFTFKIYDADGATVLYESEVLTAYGYPTEIVHNFDTITVTDNFWIAIAPTNAATGMPSSLGHGDNTNGYSGEPGAWVLDLEWYTSVYMMGAGEPLRLTGTSFKEKEPAKIKNFDNSFRLDKVPEVHVQHSRALLGYNLFRNGTMVNEELLTGTTYADMDLDAGVYTYYATAVWHMGESGPSNDVTATLAFGDLEGYVTDSETTDPIEGAIITAGSYGATTDATGYYLIEGMLIGMYDVSATATLYEASDPVTVEITDGGVAVVDFALVSSGGGDVYFYDDFESGGGNWVFEGSWGITDEEAHSPINSMHDSPGGNYGANLNISSTLAVPWDLSGVLDATLSYWYMCDIETAFDYMYVEVTTDGTTWLNLATYDIQDMTEFVEESISFGGFVGPGYETVSIRFRLETDGGFEINGMYIDDVLVTTSMDDFAAPFIVHDGPDFYEGTAEDYVFTADIVDVSGIAEANVVFTLDGTDETTLPYTSVDGTTYTFTIPAQDAGVQVDYSVNATDASDNSNFGEMDGYVYIAGTPFIYDNGIVDFYTVIAEGTGAAVKIVNPAGFQLNLAYALIRNYTDQSGQDNDDMEFHVWADDGGVPGADLITPFVISPEASYDNTSAMTRVDLRDYSAELTNIVGDFYVGFLANTGGQFGEVHCTITQPGNFANSFLFDGAGWTFWDGTDLHFRAVAELVPTSIGTVEGIVTRSDLGTPLEGALVSVGSATGLTMADGSYSIIADPGMQDVTCVLDGYNDFMGSVDVIENQIVTYDIQLSPAFWAPVNLTYTYNPPNPNVVLQWDEPEPPAGGEIVELIYDDDVSTGAYSYVGYSMCTQMSPDAACQILELKIHTSAGSQFNAEVWGWDTAPTEDLLYQELITTVATDDWNVIDVSGEGLMVDGDFLVGFGSIAADTYMSYDGNLDNGRSWDHADAGGWATWAEAYLLRAVVQYADGRIVELSPAVTESVVPANRALRAGNRISIDVEDHNVGSSTRELTGYNVYRDDVLIGSAVSTFYLDAGVPAGTHLYYVTAVYEDPTGESGPSNVVEVPVVGSDDNIIPLVTELTGNYPNPFNPVTNINFALSEAGNVTIDIFNIKGEIVKTLVNGFMAADYYTLTWNGTDDNENSVSSGVYFYKMRAGRYTSTKKMILMK